MTFTIVAVVCGEEHPQDIPARSIELAMTEARHRLGLLHGVPADKVEVVKAERQGRDPLSLFEALG